MHRTASVNWSEFRNQESVSYSSAGILVCRIFAALLTERVRRRVPVCFFRTPFSLYWYDNYLNRYTKIRDNHFCTWIGHTISRPPPPPFSYKLTFFIDPLYLPSQIVSWSLSLKGDCHNFRVAINTTLATEGLTAVMPVIYIYIIIM